MSAKAVEPEIEYDAFRFTSCHQDEPPAIHAQCRGRHNVYDNGDVVLIRICPCECHGDPVHG